MTSFSFIVQGPVIVQNNITQRVLTSIRAYYPESEIILSTWDGSDTSSVEPLCDKIVRSQDPGGYVVEIDGYLNVNRQIVSSQAGVQQATRPYAIKTRTDILFTSDDLVNLYMRYNVLQKNGGILGLSEKLLVTNLTSINPERCPYVFAISDWIYAGKTEDLKQFLNVPLYPEEFTRFFKSGETSLKYNAEQWLIIKNIEKHYPLIFENGKEINEHLRLLHAIMVKEDLIIASFGRLGIKSLKYSFFRFGLRYMYTFNEWRAQASLRTTWIDFERIFYDITSIQIVRKIGKAILQK